LELDNTIKLEKYANHFDMTNIIEGELVRASTVANFAIVPNEVGQMKIFLTLYLIYNMILPRIKTKRR
jgi:hypothetical protein